MLLRLFCALIAVQSVANDTLPATEPVTQSPDIAAYNAQLSQAYDALEQQQYAQAEQLLAELIRLKHPAAIYAKAMMLQKGWGTEMDIQQSHDLYLEAAEMGHINAGYELGKMLRQGIDGVANFKDAIFWYEFAAMRQHPQAMFDLGAMNFYGMGMEMNKEIAEIWMRKAAAKNHAMAIHFVENNF